MARNKQDNISESFFKTCKICGKKLALRFYYTNREWKTEFYADVWCKKCVANHVIDIETLKTYCKINRREYNESLYLTSAENAKIFLDEDKDYIKLNTNSKLLRYWDKLKKLYFQRMNMRGFYVYDCDFDTDTIAMSDDNKNFGLSEYSLEEIEINKGLGYGKKTYNKNWCGLYTANELDYLEDYYNGLYRDFKLENTSYIDYAKKVCKASLAMDKAFADLCNGKLGSEKKYKDFKDIFDSLSNSAKFAEKTRSETDTVGFGSLGELIKRMEQTGYLQKKKTFPSDEIDNIISDFRWTLASLGEDV